MENSIIDIKVSFFENCSSTIPKEISLLNWLTNNKYQAKIENLRSIQDEDLQGVIKKSLPAITPCGLFSYRDTEHLIEHSGFLVFDIDKKDNKHISFEGLKEQISHIPSVAYCGLSCRGFGFWGLVPIPKSTPEEHKQRFSALAKDFKAFDINLDPSGSDVCRLRIYSWDPDAYFNHNAKLYTKLLKPQVKKSTRPAYSDTRERVEAIISQIKENKIDITSGYKEEWLKIASALANEFGESGRGYFHSVSQYHAKYDSNDTDCLFDNVLKHDYNKISIGSFFHIAGDYSIKIQDGQKKGEIAKQSNGGANIPNGVPKENTVKTLSDIGISRKEVTTLVEKIVKPGIWSNEITELDQFFSMVKLPGTLKLNACSTITDINLFIKSHMDIVRGQNGKTRYKPYLDRLIYLRSLLCLN